MHIVSIGKLDLLIVLSGEEAWTKTCRTVYPYTQYPYTQYTGAGGKKHIRWASRINNKKVKRVVRISDELGTLEGALQQAQQATESDARSDTLQALRIMGLKVQIAQHELFFAEEEAAATTARLADVVQDVAQPLAGTYCYPCRTKGGPKVPSWAKDERPPEQYNITLESVLPALLLLRKEAAAPLGIYARSLSRACRKLGVLHWPRQIARCAALAKTKNVYV